MAAEKDPETTEQETKKKSKLPFFIILAVGICVLGGGGFFAYNKFLAHKPAVEEVASQETKKEAAPVIGEMLVMEPFVVNLADPRGKRYLKVKIELELESKEAVDKATKATPKLRDMVIMMLTSLGFEEVMTPEGKIRVRDELLERFNEIMRPDHIKNIYFTEFVVQ
ncbi:flagellar basal body-associated FliL family protein [Thiovibrio frasassiensis]|uniref:Flagellar protein FliL n=1 Tax=Thiovibrio frasassiensis TaxID=2984131 RepID=A0A9X4MC33_9BACT|nr:flagellar basal body-associated FliL family protein [Thiovibrio frasassiensis]MDG4474854.1 flagellar basal body-associated FliL family protein [Thiovibrio frasassiensis]